MTRGEIEDIHDLNELYNLAYNIDYTDLFADMIDSDQRDAIISDRAIEDLRSGEYWADVCDTLSSYAQHNGYSWYDSFLDQLDESSEEFDSIKSELIDYMEENGMLESEIPFQGPEYDDDDDDENDISNIFTSFIQSI